jgi:HprK-related kinase A
VSSDCYDILGLRVMVRSTSWEFAAQVRRLMSCFPVAPEGSGLSDVVFSLVAAPPPKRHSIRPFHFLYKDGTRAGRITQQWQLFRFLECQLDILLAEKVDRPLLLHAGAVARNGCGVIMPGPSGSGKSSLTLALLQRGFRYYSDEIAVVDPATGWLHPFPKPVSIKDRHIFNGLAQHQDLWFGPEANEDRGVWYLHPEDLTGGKIGEPSPTSYIVFPKYHPDYQPRLRHLPFGEALKELVHNSINLSRSGNEGFRLLAGLVREAHCFTLESNDLTTSVALVNGLVDTTG